MPSCDPKPGEIWLAYVEFLDHPGIGKVRPVFVIGVENEMCIAIAAKVTSKDLSADGSGRCVPIIDWRECGLLKPSYLRIDQKLEVAFENLLRDEPLGTLSPVYLELVVGGIERIRCAGRTSHKADEAARGMSVKVRAAFAIVAACAKRDRAPASDAADLDSINAYVGPPRASQRESFDDCGYSSTASVDIYARASENAKVRFQKPRKRMGSRKRNRQGLSRPAAPRVGVGNRLPRIVHF